MEHQTFASGLRDFFWTGIGMYVGCVIPIMFLWMYLVYIETSFKNPDGSLYGGEPAYEFGGTLIVSLMLGFVAMAIPGLKYIFPAIVSVYAHPLTVYLLTAGALLLVSRFLLYYPLYWISLRVAICLLDPIQKLDDIIRSGGIPSMFVSDTLRVKFEMMIAKLNAERMRYERRY